MSQQFKPFYLQLLQQIRSDPSKTQNILVSIQNTSQFWITLNRPKKMNSFSPDMFAYFIQLIQKANQIPYIKYIIITGTGENFSSGNDLNNFLDPRFSQFQGEQKKLVSKFMAQVIGEFASVLIESRKPLFGLVKGRVVGFAFTQLTLYDKVFASKDARFMAPLVKIAQGPQMCSSYLFPKVFGKRLAQEIVIEGRQITSQTAQKHGLIESHSDFDKAKIALQEHLAYLDQLEWESYLAARHLFREPQREKLRKINHQQSENLYQRWIHPKLVDFLVEYMNRKKNRNSKK